MNLISGLVDDSGKVEVTESRLFLIADSWSMEVFRMNSLDSLTKVAAR